MEVSLINDNLFELFILRVAIRMNGIVEELLGLLASRVKVKDELLKPLTVKRLYVLLYFCLRHTLTFYSSYIR